MIIAREESLMRTNEHANKLKEESTLNSLNYELALNERNKKIAKIEEGQKKLLEQGFLLKDFQK